MPYPDLKQSVSSRDPLWERNRQLEAAIREAISTLPDYAETLDNSAACDVKWVKQHLIAVLNH